MDFPTPQQLRARGTRKWTAYDSDVLPLWIAESDFPTPAPVLQAVREAVAQETLGYTPAPHASGLNAALAQFYAQRFGWRPEEKNIFWIGDVVRGMLLGVQYFTRPDSAVIVPVPSYPPLLEIPATAGREKIETSLDLDEIEAAFAAGAGSILLANPFNPLGRVFDRDFLQALVDMARRYNARILSDEIHAGIVFEGTHIPIASLGPDVALTVTATSKAFNVAGLKCAQIIFSNDADRRTFQGLSGVAKDGTGTLGVLAAEAAYRDGGPFLDAQVDYLRQTRDWLVPLLRERLPGVEVTNPQATYLLWLDFRGTGLDKPAAWLLEHARVALNEGTTFAAPGHARLNFATSTEILTEAVDHMAAALLTSDR
ncbi:aminotransferase class I/II-fold pyridoxal phosphate-dependent enzyme [Corynebacterium lizhenjunii]|uniref:cysteine-S-conjugate beta-lyase n=1 Tax=Corynebacterium lizhenjunii TaxID=2709394 RepID=A0A7T0KGY8_9CORY|nr:aminotransferase class I/II-fold pyridoxal phosphate-dependent enzyme [Corynebacterium lizhenjunii]QPK80377.1 aminotransferase class I/II-fold pyridoxal phosphate-dependent enzyme [Corynebacterium lizhenjunii]